MHIVPEVRDLPRSWLRLIGQVTLRVALVSCPFVVIFSDLTSGVGVGLIPLHAIFMVLFLVSNRVVTRSLANSRAPIGCENFCAGFSAGAAAIYTLSFWPLSILALIMLALFPWTEISGAQTVHILALIFLVNPLYFGIIAVLLSPILLGVITIKRAGQVRRRMAVPSSLLPAGAALAFVSISTINLPITSLQAAQNLSTSPDARIAKVTHEWLKSMPYQEKFLLGNTILDSHGILGRTASLNILHSAVCSAEHRW